MTISGIGSSAGLQSQQNIKKANARLQAAIANLASGSKLNKASDNVAALSIATQLQSEVSGLKQASGNLAQAASLTQVADGGAEKIQDLLDKMKELATQANAPTLSEDNRKQLNEQFQQLRAQIDRFAENTTFNSQKLLDGSQNGAKAISVDSLLGEQTDDADTLEIQSLTSTSLLGKTLDISTGAGASDAVATLGDALNKVTSVRSTIGSFQRSLDYAAANIDSVVANQQAAISELRDTDFAEGATESSMANIQRNAAIAVQAQAKNLSPALLKLVN